MSQQNAAWDEFLEATAAASESEHVPFALTPDESMENPEAHLTPVKFTKTPAFLWALATGGFVGFVLLIYGVSAYLTNTRKVVASAPSTDVNLFDENTGKKELLPRVPESPELQPIAQAPVVPKKTPKRIGRQTRTREVTPERVVYRPSQRSYAPQSYVAPRSYAPPARVPVQQIAPVSRPPSLRPVAVPQIKQQPEMIGALYAPESGEGPAVDTDINSTPIAQGSNKAIEQALTLYDGTESNKLAQAATPAVDKSDASPVEEAQSEDNQPHQKIVPGIQPKAIVAMDDPLTAAEYEKQFPQKAAQERLMARLAIPSETKIKGQVVGSLTWGSQENFPTGKEIKIKINSDYKRDGEVVIPKGSMAIATSEEGTIGQYIMATVTRIETPSGETFSVPAGMLTASNSDGYIQGTLKEPKQGGGAGRVLSRLGRSVLAIGAASVMPQGDSFSDRVVQNVAAEGIGALDTTLDGTSDRYGYSNRRSQVPSFFVVRPKTTISLVANDDIELSQE